MYMSVMFESVLLHNNQYHLLNLNLSNKKAAQIDE